MQVKVYASYLYKMLVKNNTWVHFSEWKGQDDLDCFCGGSNFVGTVFYLQFNLH